MLPVLHATQTLFRFVTEFYVTHGSQTISLQQRRFQKKPMSHI